MNKVGLSDDFFKNLPELSNYNLNQGIFEGRFYFGKKIEINGIFTDSVVFSDGSYLVNFKKTDKNKDNQIDDAGLRVRSEMMPQKRSWSNWSINEFIEYVSSVDSVDIKEDIKNQNSVDSVDAVGCRVYNSLCRIPLQINSSSVMYKQITYNYTSSMLSTLSTLNTQKEVGKVLLETLIKIFEQYLDVTDGRIYLTAALYNMATYCYTLFNTLGIFFIVGERESGKTKMLNLFDCLSFNPIDASNPTDSALFRSVEMSKGTLLIDDFENMDDDRKKALLQILKCGYKVGGTVTRSEKKKEGYVPVPFDCYCPKILTNTSSLEPTTLSRCFFINLEKTATEKGEREVDLNLPVWNVLRDFCHVFVMTNYDEIASIYDTYECKELKSRNLELVKGLLAIARFIDPVYEDQAIDFFVKSFDQREISQGNTWDIALFKTLYEISREEGDWFTAKYIGRQLVDELGKENAPTSANRWVSKKLSLIPSFKKTRAASGIKFFFSKAIVKKYADTRGFKVVKEEEEDAVKNPA